MSELSTDVSGADELAAGMRRIADQLRGPGFFNWGRDAGALLLREARLKAPADTGEMRARFDMEVMQAMAGAGATTQTVVGSKLERAVWQEAGTDPHWPPPGALEVWAKRHPPWTDFTIRRHISRYGTKAKWMFRDALEENVKTIFQWMGDLIGRILTNG